MIMKNIINHHFYLGDLRDAYVRLDIENEVGLSYDECDWAFLYSEAEPTDMRELIVTFKDSFQLDEVEVNAVHFEGLNTDEVKVRYAGSNGQVEKTVSDEQVFLIQRFMDELEVDIDLM